jgi:transposase
MISEAFQQAIETRTRAAREAAERFEINVSVAVKWLQSWPRHGVCAPKPRRDSRSVLEDYADRILAIIEEQPDRTLDELCAAMRKRRILGSRSALWRSFAYAAPTWHERGAAEPDEPEYFDQSEDLPQEEAEYFAMLKKYGRVSTVGGRK